MLFNSLAVMSGSLSITPLTFNIRLIESYTAEVKVKVSSLVSEYVLGNKIDMKFFLI